MNKTETTDKDKNPFGNQNVKNKLAFTPYLNAYALEMKYAVIKKARGIIDKLCQTILGHLFCLFKNEGWKNKNKKMR